MLNNEVLRAATKAQHAGTELGGKAPLVVLDDPDLDAGVTAAAFGAFMNRGHICVSSERIVVDHKVADAFVAKFAAKAETRTFLQLNQFQILPHQTRERACKDYRNPVVRCVTRPGHRTAT